MAQVVDFTSSERVCGRAYNGANGKKIAVQYDGSVWILKFPPDAHEKPNGLSYSNSCISEHIGSTIFRKLGIPSQDTILGIYCQEKKKIVCACRDFTSSNTRLLDFCSIKNSVLETGSGGTGTELDDIIETIEQQSFMDAVVVKRRFWQMFVVDALIGNFDRHNGNWGFLINQKTGKTELAPVFDCGSCLLPQADESIMQRCLEDKTEMDARIYSFPASMIKIGGRKISYYEFLHSKKLPDGLYESLSLLLPKIKLLDFSIIVDDIPYLDSLQSLFYKSYLTQRREKIFSDL